MRERKTETDLNTEGDRDKPIYTHRYRNRGIPVLMEIPALMEIEIETNLQTHTHRHKNREKGRLTFVTST